MAEEPKDVAAEAAATAATAELAMAPDPAMPLPNDVWLCPLSFFCFVRCLLGEVGGCFWFIILTGRSCAI